MFITWYYQFFQARNWPITIGKLWVEQNIFCQTSTTEWMIVLLRFICGSYLTKWNFWFCLFSKLFMLIVWMMNKIQKAGMSIFFLLTWPIGSIFNIPVVKSIAMNEIHKPVLFSAIYCLSALFVINLPIWSFINIVQSLEYGRILKYTKRHSWAWFCIFFIFGLVLS